jgi:Ca2+/Na+ antiporter
MLKAYKLSFIFLTLITAFFTGVSFALVTGAAENQGLAAAAIVLGYGALAAVFGIGLAIFASGKMNRRVIVRSNYALLLCILCFYVYFRYQYNQRQKAKDQFEKEEEIRRPKTRPPSGFYFRSCASHVHNSQNAFTEK